VELSDDLAEMCVKLSAGLGLALAGIDLKITKDNRVYCFEVNPSPAFSYYEANTGQPIALAVAGYLAGE
jgi:glutathione synthase/RimK-type ligase-like ATP-grasp enzyme